MSSLLLRGLPLASRLSFASLSRQHLRCHIIRFGSSPMSRDVSHLSDIAKSPTEADGSFKRPASSFRNFIQAGGQFPPERGTYTSFPHSAK